MTGLTQPGLRAEFSQTLPVPLSGRFEAEPGQMVGLVGRSGAGKTSVLRILAGLAQPSSGHVAVGPHTWQDSAQGIWVPPQHRKVGLVFQNYALMPHLSALENVRLALGGLPRPQAQALAQEWLNKVQLTPALWARRPAQLSGGQQQRVALARALAREPALLLLDEPFSAVDQMTRRKLYTVLENLRGELNIPIVLVTHDLQEARLLCEQLVVMEGGEVLQQGCPSEVYRRPRNRRVADLVGLQNRFSGRWLGEEGLPGGFARFEWLNTLKPGDLSESQPLVLRTLSKGKIPPGFLMNWVIHNDGIRVLGSMDEPENAPSPGSNPGVNRIPCELASIKDLGDVTLLEFKPLQAPRRNLRVGLSGQSVVPLVQGQSYWVELNPEMIHVMPKHRSSSSLERG